MQSIIDEFINNYQSYDNGKISLESNIGTITFIKNKKNNTITVFEIYIKEEFRRMGHCRKFLENLIDECDKINKNLIVVSVLSKILYNFLLKFNHKNRRFKLNNEGFICKINR